MTTLKLFTAKNLSIPSSTPWYLADLGEFCGKQALYTQQPTQWLKTLREHALIESAVSYDRTELQTGIANSCMIELLPTCSH